jgi:hypothetical protein
MAIAPIKKAYRVKGTFFYDRLYTDGETVLYDGEAGDNLELLTGAEAKKATDRVDDTYSA